VLNIVLHDEVLRSPVLLAHVFVSASFTNLNLCPYSWMCRAGEPYVIVFAGINGVGKSTSLAKVTYLLKINGHRVSSLHPFGFI
jgi:hypothetical protein